MDLGLNIFAGVLCVIVVGALVFVWWTERDDKNEE